MKSVFFYLLFSFSSISASLLMEEPEPSKYSYSIVNQYG